MHLFYIDESYDEHRFVISAVGMRAEQWRAVLTSIQEFRRGLRSQFGIKVTREIHASSFIRDCGDDISSRKLNVGERRHAFELCIRHLATLPIRIINVCLRVPGRPMDTTHYFAIERLVNRIEATMGARKSNAILIFDEGKERQITRLVRKMAVFNPVPSKYGIWPDGSFQKNIAVQYILEDPVFRPSSRSLLLQCADHAAFTLLKRETPLHPFIKRWGYQRLFALLQPVLFLGASNSDPEGIVR